MISVPIKHLLSTRMLMTATAILLLSGAHARTLSNAYGTNP